MKRIYLITILTIAMVIPISGQSSVIDTEPTVAEPTATEPTVTEPTSPVPPVPDTSASDTSDEKETGGAVDPDTEETAQDMPTGFGRLSFGMTMEEAKDALSGDPNFDYRGDPDVTLLNRPNLKAIDTRGIGFVDRGFFRFHKGQLYLIHILLNPDEMDHYTMFSTLSEKYGEPDYLDPRITFWEDSGIRIALERPLSVKYIYMPVFQSLFEEDSVEESIQAMYRESFLEQF